LQQYSETIERFAAEDGGHIDADTIVSRNSYNVALRAAGAVCDALQRVLHDDDTRALCLVRPPGHHALRHAAMGFCLFNNVAIGARTATEELDVDRALIVDFDVHHGNGTQAAFWEDPRVGFFSMHRWPFYPGSGRADETGAGPGLGATANLPIEFGTPPDQQMQWFADELTRFADKLKPQLVLVSAGFDAHRQDPVGSLGLDLAHFGELTQIVLDVADAHASGRIVSVLEGGYNPPVLAECVALHLEQMLDREGD